MPFDVDVDGMTEGVIAGTTPVPQAPRGHFSSSPSVSSSKVMENTLSIRMRL